MTGRVFVERTYNPFILYQFATKTEIWATVAEDGQDPAKYQPDVTTDCWLKASVDNAVIGVVQLSTRNGVTLEAHIQVLPERRKQYSIDVGQGALKWVRVNAPWCEKVIAWVPTLYPNVRRYAEALGFALEGESKASYRKNGELVGQWLMGITRPEIEATVKWAE